jgi:hypothetical protein
MFAASTSLAGGKTGIWVIPKSRNLGFDSLSQCMLRTVTNARRIVYRHYRVLGN